MNATVADQDLQDWAERLPPLDRSPGRWFGVPAELVFAAPTRVAALEMAKLIAAEHLPRLLEVGVADIRVIDRYKAGGSSVATASWRAEAILVLKAVSGDDARRQVEQACRRDVGSSYVFLGFRPAHEIEDQDRLSPACRHLVTNAAGILTHYLWGDIESIVKGTPFDETTALAVHLPQRFKAAYDVPFLERWVGTVEMVGIDLLRYPHAYFASTAQELAAHAILGEAQEQLDAGLWETTGDKDLHEQLVEELDVLLDCAFEDHDILMAFGEGLSPAERPDIAAMMGIANFTPDVWFAPFREQADA